jgi:hypothetical protein
MKSAGWTVLFVLAVIIASSAPGIIWLGGLVLLGVWVIASTKRDLSEGREPRGIVELIEDLFSGWKR